MKLKLTRDVFTDLSTTGKLTVDDEYFSFTLEDTDRKMEAGGEKVYGKTCVPRGAYDVVLNFSNRYQKVMPQVMDVPGFEGIRIHAGNFHGDTNGCVLLGSTRSTDFVGNSMVTFDRLMGILEDAYDRQEPITLEIV